MMLSALNPSYYCRENGRGGLTIDCPLCGSSHRFNIPTIVGASTEATGIKRWGISGEPPRWSEVSLEPSVDLQERCRWHGTITNGNVEPSREGQTP